VFVRLFSELAGASAASAEDAAETAYATLVGLRANSFYDAQLTAAQANRLFKEALLRLAGLPSLQSANVAANAATADSA
jgi:hypothetical protein